MTEEKTKDRKQHIVVDVLGCLLSVVVHATNIHDTKGGISTAKRAYERFPSIRKFCADAGYRGTFVSDLKEQLGLDVDISEKIKPHQWESFLGDGWLNAPSPGSITPDASVKIVRFTSHLLRLWSLFPTLTLCSNAYEYRFLNTGEA